MSRQNQLTDYLDKEAYSRPGKIPEEIRRNDKALYRLYFRFMVCLYELHKKGVDAEKLQKIKQEFISDFCRCEIQYKAAIKSCREGNRLNFALMECRKNSENCDKCKAVSEIWGAPTGANEPDLPDQEADNGVQ